MTSMTRSPIFSGRSASRQIGYIEGRRAFDMIGNPCADYDESTGLLRDTKGHELLGYISLRNIFVGSKLGGEKLIFRTGVDAGPQLAAQREVDDGSDDTSLQQEEFTAREASIRAQTADVRVGGINRDRADSTDQNGAERGWSVPPSAERGSNSLNGASQSVTHNDETTLAPLDLEECFGDADAGGNQVGADAKDSARVDVSNDGELNAAAFDVHEHPSEIIGPASDGVVIVQSTVSSASNSAEVEPEQSQSELKTEPGNTPDRPLRLRAQWLRASAEKISISVLTSIRPSSEELPEGANKDGGGLLRQTGENIEQVEDVARRQSPRDVNKIPLAVEMFMQ